MNRSIPTRSNLSPRAVVLSLTLMCVATGFWSAAAEAGPPPPFHTSAAATTGVFCPVRQDFQTAPRHSAAAVGCVDVVRLDPFMFNDGRASAEARQGLLRAEALIHSKGNLFSDARATAIFSDTLVVNSALAPPGTAGRLEIRLPYSGRLDADLEASGGPSPTTVPTATVFLEVQVETGQAFFGGFADAERVLHQSFGQPEGVLIVPIEFVFGQPFRVEARLAVDVEADIGGFEHHAFASSRYGSTAWWEGVREVELLNGDQVAEFQILSESGTDYSIDLYQGGGGLELIHSGGDIVTHPGQGADGADVSMVGTDAPVLGFNAFNAPDGESEWRIADVFELPRERVVERILTYALEPDTPTPAWTGFDIKLFRLEAGVLEEVVISATASIVPTGAYRVATGEAFLGSTEHPVHAIEWNLHPMNLPAGEYRIEWQVEGGNALALAAMAVDPGVPHDPITVSGKAEILTPEGWRPLGGEFDRALATPLQVLGPPVADRVFADRFEP